MAITYDAPSNTITVTGYTEETPCTFLDIWNADQAGGWGVVSKQGDVQFMFDCKLIIGDGSIETWFADKNKQVTFNDIDIVSYENLIHVKDYASFTMGTLIDAVEKSTKDGVQFLSLCDHYTPSWHQPAFLIYANIRANIYLYSCSFIAVDVTSIFTYGRTGYGEVKIYNCYLERTHMKNEDRGFNIVIVGCADMAIDYLFPEGERFYFYNNTRILYTHSTYGFTAKNLYCRGNTYMARPSGWSGTGYFINTDSDNWAWNWAGTCTGIIYRQYELDIHVSDYKDGSDIAGAVVTLYDKDDNEVFSVTTDANGDIETQTVTYGYYDQAGGDIMYDKSPHKLIVKKSGYQTEQDIFDMDEKKVLQVSLQKAIAVFFDMGRPVVNLKKSDPENKNVMVL